MAFNTKKYSFLSRGTDRIRQANNNVLVLETGLTERSRDKLDASVACLEEPTRLGGTTMICRQLRTAEHSTTQHAAHCGFCPRRVRTG